MRCVECEASFSISEAEREVASSFGFEAPCICFRCSQRERLAFRGERVLYRRQCDFSGENIISVYSEDKPFKVYKSDHWYSDRWDGLHFGRAFDFSRPFFAQFAELQREVPRIALSNVRGENSDYCHSTVGNKNSYLLFGGDNNQDCMYGTLSMRNIMTHDADYGNRNEWCYMLSDSADCYGCLFAFNCKNCNDCAFISDCVGCSECILCTNLVRRSYCIGNREYPREEYFQRKQALLSGSCQTERENIAEFEALLRKRVVKYAHIVNSENCSGDYILNSKNCDLSFDVAESEDLANIIFGDKSKDCYNCSMLGEDSKFCYNFVSGFGSSNVRSSFFVIYSSNVDYSDLCIDSRDLFGCVGLRRKQYCILNRQYPEIEYTALRERIIAHMKSTGEWGRFFPKELSAFCFNESTALRYFPLEKGEAVRRGYEWKDHENADSEQPSIELPDRIQDVGDDIVRRSITCKRCAKKFRVLLQELRFYQRLTIPVPRHCPDCRHVYRLGLRNPAQLWDRTCARCSSAIRTSYAPGRPETVYCERCYHDTVFA